MKLLPSVRSISRPDGKRSSGSGPTDVLSQLEPPMIVGVPREIKTNENRVALVPAGAEALVADGHTVLVEKTAGLGSGFSDETYAKAGATLVGQAAEVWSKAEMIFKVKEP